ncbi:hypothetical protein [Aeoliella sp.]|uniref:hypothetical protein n=1 Tax=Aeoliella sp. TaxID=2795800 RepID=UPI003CCB764C
MATVTPTRRSGTSRNFNNLAELRDYVLEHDAWHLLKWTDNVEPLSAEDRWAVTETEGGEA